MNKSMYEQKYLNECVPFLMKEFGYSNPMQVPKLKMIVVNTSIKEATQDAKILDAAVNDLTAISGQRAVVTRAKKSISNFKLREGQPIGCRVTLRRKAMFEFLNKLVNITLPRVRDFKGVSPRSFDGQGNYTLGLTEQTIFPEINPDKVSKVFGMNITFVTTAKTDKEGKALLKFMGMPFRN